MGSPSPDPSLQGRGIRKGLSSREDNMINEFLRHSLDNGL